MFNCIKNVDDQLILQEVIEKLTKWSENLLPSTKLSVYMPIGKKFADPEFRYVDIGVIADDYLNY